jgi:hypothetical protein
MLGVFVSRRVSHELFTLFFKLKLHCVKNRLKILLVNAVNKHHGAKSLRS